MCAMRKKTEYNDPDFLQYTPDFSEWNALEYDLQLALGTCTATLKEAYKISKPQSSLKFEKKVNRRDLLTCNSFIDVRTLKDGSVHKIVKEGFDFPANGLVFSSGYVHMDKNQHFQGRDYEVLLCKVAVGRSMTIPIKSSLMSAAAKAGNNHELGTPFP